MEKSNVYTQTGDNGTTSLVGGQRVKKTHIRLETYGTVDELSSWSGVLAASKNMETPIKEYLHTIQNKLFNIGAYLATENKDGEQIHITGLTKGDIEKMEHSIDATDGTLPKLNRFVLPGGGQDAANAHICRTVTRRCERRVLALSETTHIDPLVIKYLNRLSDFFTS